MQLYLILAAIGLIWSAGITTTGYIKGRAAGVEITTERFESQIAKQKIEADKLIATETANVAATEKKLRDFKDNQEITDATNQKKISKLSNDVRHLSGALGRMRDPHSSNDCGPKGSPSTSSGNSENNGAENGGLLSAEISQLLSTLTREADEINAAYISCRSDAFSIRSSNSGK